MPHSPRPLEAAAALGLKSGICVALAALVCACAPDLGPRPSLLAPSALKTDRSFAVQTAAEWPKDAWWSAYGDAELSRLIALGLKDSPTVAEAAGRLRTAGGYAGEAEAQSRPSLFAQGAVQDYLQSKNVGFPAFIQPLLPGSFHPLGAVNLDFAYNLDLFGKQRALVAAASSEAEAASADYAEARLSLSTAIAAAYADLRRLQAERAQSAALLKVRQDVVALVAARTENGIETRGELKTQAVNIPAARLDLANLDRQIALARNQIAALIGKGPDDGLDIAPPDAAPKLSALAAPADLPAALLGRRPDVVAARLRAKAAAKRITAANADFYPNVNLTGAIGYQSLGLGAMFDKASRMGQFGPALTLPIYSGGAAKAGYQAAFGQAETAAAAYDPTLVMAVKDVADALVNRRAVEAQLGDARQALAHAEEADALMKDRVRAGIANRTSSLATEAAVLIQKRSVTDLESLAFAYDVALVRALGGGYVEQNPRSKTAG